ncbi:hypothetical protein AAULR_25906, partial [Lacticaseibacillus rhamnosus MTCC 5462]
DGDDLGTRGLDGRARLFEVLVLAGADQQARLIGATGRVKGLSFGTGRMGKSSFGRVAAGLWAPQRRRHSDERVRLT